MTDTQAPTLDPALREETPDTLVNLYADRLINELFSPLESALEGDEAALADLQRPLNAEDDSPLGAAPTLPLGADFPGISLAALTTPSPAPDPAADNQPQRRWWRRRWVWGLGGLVGLAAIASTLGFYQWQREQGTAPATVSSASEPVASPQQEFLEYLRRSLDVIAQNANSADAPGRVADIPLTLNGGAIGLPPINGDIGTSPLANGSGPPQINVIERVYIPYQPEGSAVTPSPAAPAPSSPAPIPTLPTPGPSAPAPPAVLHTLVGVLELGDRSAALFEINGVPQRVYIGERIANSGWFLVSVADGEAMIRRNGEVRSIYIGQRF